MNNLKNVEMLKPTGLFTNYIYKAIPLAFDESMSYYETLLGLLHYLKETILPTVNNNAEALIELQNLYTQLREYVDNYFDNLDVQDEINNKLDEMVEDGTLPEIVASYLNSKAIFGFDNVALMKQATNLINGSFAQTLGYYNKNDDGNSLYKIRTITNDDIVDEKFIIALSDNSLIGELIIDNNTNVKSIGAYGNDTNDDSSFFTAFINKLNYLKVPKGTYKLNSSINISNINVNIEGTIHYTGNDFAFIIDNANYKTYNFKTVTASNGGFLKLSTSSNNQIIYNEFNIVNGSAKNENLLLDGTNGSISLNNFKCNRLRSTNTSCISMVINNGNNTYITENNFIGIDIKATNNKGVSSIASGTSVEIQYILTNCDLEGCDGLYSKGKVTFITLNNCRLLEIVSKQNWITLEDTLPMITIIGAGIIYPKNIELINISSSSTFLRTNMPIFVNESGYYYSGGNISKNSISNLASTNRMNKTITDSDLTDEHYYELPTGYNDNIYNMFTLNVSKWSEITIPNNPNYQEFIFRVVNNQNVTLKAQNGNTIFTPMEAGYYKLYYINNRIYYTKLNIQ